MIIEVLKKNIISLWLEWHFFDVSKNILIAWKNYLKFNLDYFSVPLLIKTFFSPWRKYKMSYDKGFNIKKYFETLSFNMMSRIIGAFLRLFFIFFGILIEILIFFIGGIIFISWIILPALLLIGIFYGSRLLF